jgi:hypothetical protein
MFEPGAQARRFEDGSFLDCVALRAICILASVEFIGNFCFLSCVEMSTVAFEPGSIVIPSGSHAAHPAREGSPQRSLGEFDPSPQHSCGIGNPYGSSSTPTSVHEIPTQQRTHARAAESHLGATLHSVEAKPRK